jgi:hypothetical protein
MQDANDTEGVVLQKVVNADGLKSPNRPGAQILKPGVLQLVLRTHEGMLAQRLNGTPDSFPKTNGNLGEMQRNEVIPKVPYQIVAGAFPI